jgi:hypothetical protein
MAILMLSSGCMRMVWNNFSGCKEGTFRIGAMAL